MYHRVARLIIIFAVIAASSAAVRPGLAQPSPSTSVFLPAVSNQSRVEIGDSQYYQGGKLPGFGVMGHVRNNGSTPVYGVTLHADFYDQHGDLEYSATFSAALPVLFAGEAIPFFHKNYWPLNREPYVHGYYELRLVSVDDTSTAIYAPVTIVSKRVHRIEWLGGRVGGVDGELRNDQARALRDVLVVASNALGELEPAGAFAVLAPGMRATYDTGSLVYREWSNDVVTVHGVGILAP